MTQPLVLSSPDMPCRVNQCILSQRLRRQAVGSDRECSAGIFYHAQNSITNSRWHSALPLLSRPNRIEFNTSGREYLTELVKLQRLEVSCCDCEVCHSIWIWHVRGFQKWWNYYVDKKHHLDKQKIDAYHNEVKLHYLCVPTKTMLYPYRIETAKLGKGRLSPINTNLNRVEKAGPKASVDGSLANVEKIDHDHSLLTLRRTRSESQTTWKETRLDRLNAPTTSKNLLERIKVLKSTSPFIILFFSHPLKAKANEMRKKGEWEWEWEWEQILHRIRTNKTRNTLIIVDSSLILNNLVSGLHIHWDMPKFLSFFCLLNARTVVTWRREKDHEVFS